MTIDIFHEPKKKRNSDSFGDDKFEGLLVNVFGLNLPASEPALAFPGLEKIEGLLVNVFGVKLPTDRVQSARSVELGCYQRKDEL